MTDIDDLPLLSVIGFWSVSTITSMRHNDLDTVSTVLGSNIKKLRKEAKCSQITFANMVGINRSNLSDIENARVNVSIGILTKIADGLDVPITKLFEGLDSAPPHALK